jgi:hypothetical protein
VRRASETTTSTIATVRRRNALAERDEKVDEDTMR